MHLQDQSYLKSAQYHDSLNLDARIALHQRFSTNSQDWFAWIFDQLNLPPSGRILDLGCGPGDLWYRNSHRIPGRCHLFLSDLSVGMVKEARSRLGNLIKRLDYSVSDAQELPFPDECFGVVLANHMLYHTQEIERALTEIRRVMVPGALLFATTVGETHLSELDDLLSRFHGSQSTYHPEPISFTLENGGDQLAGAFSNITIHRQGNNLLVTEPEPLVNYVLSSASFGVRPEQRQALFTFVDQEIKRGDGKLFIHKDSGLFIAEVPTS